MPCKAEFQVATWQLVGWEGRGRQIGWAGEAGESRRITNRPFDLSSGNNWSTICRRLKCFVFLYTCLDLPLRLLTKEDHPSFRVGALR